MDSELFQVQAEVTKTEGMGHRSQKIVFHTQENLSDETMGRIASLQEKVGWLTFNSERQIEPEDLVNLPKVSLEKDEKSPATRLRNVLHVLWEQKDKPTDTSESFYRSYMEKIINSVKEKLN